MDNLLTTYFPIREERCFTKSGLDTKRKAIIREDTNAVLGVVTEAYKPILNRNLFEGVKETFDKLNMNYQLKSMFTNDRRTYATFTFPDCKIDIGKNGEIDVVDMQMDVVNSYDASHQVWLNLGGFRLVCLNGLIIGTSIMKVSQKHFQGVAVPEICSKIKNASEIYMNEIQPRWKKWSETEVVDTDIIKKIEKRGFPKKYLDIVNAMWNAEQNRTVWNLYNCFTYATSHKVESYERGRDLSLLVSQEFEMIGR
jgi:hypothetical protein